MFRSAKSEKHKSTETLHQTSSQAEVLRHQLDRLKQTHENAMTENSRLINQLAEMEFENSLTKKKLNESENEVERLKCQLKQYVTEVQRAEELLMMKEEERNEMLDYTS